MKRTEMKPAASSQKPAERRRLPVSFWLLASGYWLVLPGGCASEKKQPTTRPSSVSQRQDDALRDPFGYKPDMSRDVSGGGIGDLDRDGLKKDLNNVLNP
ncbi:MAG TPA: hypothetical protein VGR35_16205 [Tepidisphaeraceae bacterium]|nr:hypothetical protein [Tepidisphaeraceae bacterium]